MKEREKVVPVPTNADGSVTPRRRAAALKDAVWSYTREETLELKASWKASSAEWVLVFKDE